MIGAGVRENEKMQLNSQSKPIEKVATNLPFFKKLAESHVTQNS